MVGGKIVYGAGDFARLDEGRRRRRRCPTGRRCAASAVMAPGASKTSPLRRHADAGHELCGCANNCMIHGHDHATAWSSKLPIADLRSFWGALGCACWAV
jgi:hypothetical protein